MIKVVTFETQCSSLKLLAGVQCKRILITLLLFACQTVYLIRSYNYRI